MTLWERFIQERVYLKGISPATVRYYRWVERAFRPILNAPTKAGMLECIQKLLADGTSPISVNTYLRGFKAYCRWLNEEQSLKEVFRVQFLKTEQKILNTFSAEQVKAIIAFKPTGTNLTRAHIVACLLLDTGLRISEVLGLPKENVDFDNFTLRVLGKGGKHRFVPFSANLRRMLWTYSVKQCKSATLMFGTGRDTKLTIRNFERAFKALGNLAGITGVRMSPHTCRHSFACEYLRRGGNLEFLRRILGHSSILTTQKYLRSLGVEDLQAVHNGLSLLSR